MKLETVEIFEELPNFVVLRVPSRKYPGVLIQGDSLKMIVDEIETAIEFFNTDRDESLGCMENALDHLKSRLDQYHIVCQQNNIR